MTGNSEDDTDADHSRSDDGQHGSVPLFLILLALFFVPILGTVIWYVYTTLRSLG